MVQVLLFALFVGWAAPLILTLVIRLSSLAIWIVQVVAIVAGVLIASLGWIGWFVIKPSAARTALDNARR